MVSGRDASQRVGPFQRPYTLASQHGTVAVDILNNGEIQEIPVHLRPNHGGDTHVISKDGRFYAKCPECGKLLEASRLDEARSFLVRHIQQDTEARRLGPVGLHCRECGQVFPDKISFQQLKAHFEASCSARLNGKTLDSKPLERRMLFVTPFYSSSDEPRSQNDAMFVLCVKPGFRTRHHKLSTLRRVYNIVKSNEGKSLAAIIDDSGEKDPSSFRHIADELIQLNILEVRQGNPDRRRRHLYAGSFNLV